MKNNSVVADVVGSSRLSSDSEFGLGRWGLDGDEGVEGECSDELETAVARVASVLPELCRL